MANAHRANFPFVVSKVAYANLRGCPKASSAPNPSIAFTVPKDARRSDKSFAVIAGVSPDMCIRLVMLSSMDFFEE